MLALAPTTLPETTPMEFLAAAAAARYDGVGLRLNPSPGRTFHPVVGNAALIREMKRTLADSGLAALDIFTFYLLPATDFGQYAAALELGAEFGAKYAMVNGDDPEWPRMRDSFGRFCDDAARFGLTACVEFVPFLRLATLQQALRLLAETARPNTAITMDPLHFARGGGKPADLNGLDPKLFPTAQLSDGVLGPGEPDPARLGPEMGRGERRMPGEGSLPLREILDALPAGLPLSVEVPRPNSTPLSAEEWAKRALTSTRRFLDQYYGGKSR
jgi:sugar phosphate isomerase/epimerase